MIGAGDRGQGDTGVGYSSNYVVDQAINQQITDRDHGFNETEKCISELAANSRQYIQQYNIVVCFKNIMVTLVVS